jgi:hypothetical protein
MIQLRQMAAAAIEVIRIILNSLAEFVPLIGETILIPAFFLLGLDAGSTANKRRI